MPRQLARPSPRKLATIVAAARLLRGRRQPAAFSRDLSIGPGPYPDGSPCPRRSGIPALGQPIEGPPTHHNGDLGHLPHGLGGGGGSLPGPQCLWGLVPLQGTPPYHVLEFQAVILSLHHFLPLVRHRTVLIRTDNVTVAAYINKQGGTHSTRLNALAAELWIWCRRRDVIPTASYISGQDNLIADFLSRGLSLPFAPAAGRPPPDCLAIVREAGAQAGLSERAAAFVACSRRESTLEAYNSRLAGFFSWCESHGVDPRSAPLTEVADFLIALFDKGRSISTIRGYRSATAANLTGFADGSCISTAPSLSGFGACFLPETPARAEASLRVEPSRRVRVSCEGSL